ncbi:hypothetical protein KCU65_g2917, partial [Aureobasidium melanogenum]
MSADFWAGYVSGAAGIIIGNPLDIVKVNLQRGDRGAPLLTTPTTPPILPTPSTTPPTTSQTTNAAKNLSTLLKGTAAPILGYGALNALMFITYNRCMETLHQDPAHPSSLSKTWLAGALGGFWSYELSKRVLISENPDAEKPEWMTILLCGGIAGVVTWASVFPLDVIKTRVQTQGISRPPTGMISSEQSELLLPRDSGRLSTIQVARQAYREEGLSVFFRGLGVCSFRAFFVNAVQWAVYEWMMHILLPSKAGPNSNKHD